MPAKGIHLILLCVMITLAGGCDNVAFGGLQFEVRSPPGGEEEGVGEAETVMVADSSSLPLDLGPVLYLVETSSDSRATILPIAEVAPNGYTPFPDPGNLVTRFPRGRLHAGAEFAIFLQGTRVGTFISDGTVESDEAACLVRPRGGGRVELQPELGAHRRFLAMAKEDLPVSAIAPFPGIVEDFPMRNGSVEAFQTVIRETGATWPPSIPTIRQHIQPIVLDAQGNTGIAASFVYEGTLAVGAASQQTYGIFLTAVPGPDGYRPIVAWYQKNSSGGKAFPRLVGAHDVRGIGTSDMILEVFGEEEKWFAVLGADVGGWRSLYHDPCAAIPAPETLRTFP